MGVRRRRTPSAVVPTLTLLLVGVAVFSALAVALLLWLAAVLAALALGVL